jgi:hypothetical protein
MKKVYVRQRLISGSSEVSSALKSTQQALKISSTVIFSDEGAVAGTLKSSGESSDFSGGQLEGDHRGCVN